MVSKFPICCDYETRAATFRIKPNLDQTGRQKWRASLPNRAIRVCLKAVVYPSAHLHEAGIGGRIYKMIPATNACSCTVSFSDYNISDYLHGVM